MKDKREIAREAPDEQLASAKPKRVGKTYRNPYDQFDKWCGLGPRPGWLRKWLNEGGTLEDLRIDSSEECGEKDHGSEG